MTSFKYSHWLLCLSVLLLQACGSNQPKPHLVQNVPIFESVKPVWQAKAPGSIAPDQVNSIQNEHIVLASQSNGFFILNVANPNLGFKKFSSIGPLLGSPVQQADIVYYVTRDNFLVASKNSDVLWKVALSSETFTPPLVAGGRVFISLSDKSIRAFDQDTGRELWLLQRPEEPLVLKQSGVLTAYRNTLVANSGGRILGINPDTGQVIWDAALANPRGINDLERLVDVVSPAVKNGSQLCARTFQASVSCMDVARGSLLWTKSSQGHSGLASDNNVLVGVQSNGIIQSWNIKNGERVWDNDSLRYHKLSSPLILGNTLITASSSDNFVYFFSTINGKMLGRYPLVFSDFATSPVPIDTKTFALISKSGLVNAFQISSN